MKSLLLEGNKAGNLIICGVLVVALIAFYIFSSVNNKKRMEQFRQMQGDLKAGDVVQLTSGIIGRVVRVSEIVGIKTIVIETGEKNNKSTLEVNIDAIAGVVPKEDPNAVKAEIMEDFAEDIEENNGAEFDVEATKEETQTEQPAKTEKKKKNKK